jgi:hypothetical protein
MKLFIFILGLIFGSITTALAFVTKEIIDGYQSLNNDNPWQEYHSEDDEVRKSCECCGTDIDHIIWLDSVRRESQQDGADLGFNDTSDDEEI